MTTAEQSTSGAWLEVLSPESCRALLRTTAVGRIAFTVDEFPVVLPVNYRYVESEVTPWLALRTRPGNIIDQAPTNVAFQIDGVDPVARAGWSVLVRGMLHHSEARHPPPRFDSEPWLADRTSWMFIEAALVTGRRLHPPMREWAFHVAAYL
jgi:hypothetical protein